VWNAAGLRVIRIVGAQRAGCTQRTRVVCESAMPLSERFCAGFALAATIAGDRGAELASTGLHAEIAEPLLDTVRALGALSKKERRDRVRAFLQLQPLSWPSGPTAPLRAYVLLAQGESSQTLPGWLRSAPLPRPGYKPPPELLALLRRSAHSRQA
jgi:hypothetical protein